MNKELREKIQEFAKATAHSVGAAGEDAKIIIESVRVGAEAMHALLNEWVDVNERLPEIRERDYQIVVKFDNEIFKEFWVTDSLKYDFDALGVKSWREI